MDDSESKEPEETNNGKTLSLKGRVQSGRVQQSFSRGRTKVVAVERRKKMINAPEDNTPEVVPEPVKSVAAKQTKLGGLSQQEQESRLIALGQAKVRKEKEEAQAILDEIAQKETQKEKEESDKKSAQILKEVSVSAESVDQSSGSVSRKKHTTDVDDKLRKEKEARSNQKRPSAVKNETRRRAGKLTINAALNDEERVRSLASLRRRREREKRQSMSNDPREKISRVVQLPEVITIQEFAARMSERAVDVIKLLMQQGVMSKITDVIDTDTAELIAGELGHTVNRVMEADIEDVISSAEDAEENKKFRPPVVTIMGHVDHGKTSVLDVLRETDVVLGEIGGITQHIGAYQIETAKGEAITFLDTPGHAAFTEMRARGAKVTDIVVLVVAADDGVKPQTIEAIKHVQAAEVTMIVAINKMDKPQADAVKVKNELLQHGVISEDMGGETQFVEISAKERQGIDGLVDAVLLQAELLELKANPNREAEGVVIEAKLDKGRGAAVTILLQRGTLNIGDVFVVGEECGRVRSIFNDKGESLKQALPSMPVEVLGAKAAPKAGAFFNVVSNDNEAREIAEYRKRKKQESSLNTGARASLDQMLQQQLKEKQTQEVAVIIKADVQGSVEAVVHALEKLGNEEVRVRVLFSAVGGISESDIVLANASKVPVIGFNVRANNQARQLADVEGIEIRYYNIIYDLIDDMHDALSGMLSPDLRETMLGNAKILEVFSITKLGKVAGCQVTDGLMRHGAKLRIIRDDIVLHEGPLSSLKRFKDDVKEVRAGQECGMAFTNHENLKVGDVIECYEVEVIARKL